MGRARLECRRNRRGGGNGKIARVARGVRGRRGARGGEGGGGVTDGHKGEERPAADASRGPGLITGGHTVAPRALRRTSPRTRSALRSVTCAQLISETGTCVYTCRALRTRAIFLFVGVLHSRAVYNIAITAGLSKIVNTAHVPPARK